MNEYNGDRALVPAATTALQARPTGGSLAELMQLGEVLFRSGMFGVTSPAQAVGKILAGREMGFGPVASLINVHCYDGKIDVGAHLRAAAIENSGKYRYAVVERSDAACEIRFLRREADKWVEMPGSPLRYTLEDARRKKWHLTKDGKEKSPWIKTPANMLFARVISDGFRTFAPDLTGGVQTYDADELDRDESPPPVPPVATSPSTSTEQAAPPPETTAATAQPEEAPHPLADPPGTDLLPTQDVDRLVALGNALHLSWNKVIVRLQAVYGVDSFRQLTRDQAVELTATLTKALTERHRTAAKKELAATP